MKALEMNDRQKIRIANGIVLLVTLSLMLLAPFSRPHILATEVKFGTPQNAETINQQIKMSFSRPMDEAKVGQSFSISPQVNGNTSWANNTLFFTPKETLQYDQNYTVTLSTTATDSYHRQISQAYTFQFHTKKYQLMYIGDHDQLFMTTLGEKGQPITENKMIKEYVTNSPQHIVAYLHQPPENAPTELYVYDWVTHVTRRLAADLHSQLSNLSITSDGSTLYFLSETDNGGDQNPTLKVMGYDLAKNAVAETDLVKTYPNLVHFWVTPDGNTFLVNDLNGELFLRAVSGGNSTAIGKFAEYRGGTFKGDKLLFIDSSPDQGFAQGVVIYDGNAVRITDAQEIAATPNLSGDGKILSYSYVPKNTTTTDGEEGVRILQLPEKKTLLDKYKPDSSFELSKISPDDHYVAVEMYTAYQLKNFSFIRKYGEPNKPQEALIEFIDVKTGQTLQNTLAGKEMQWVK